MGDIPSPWTSRKIMADQKPLPALPAASFITLLSVESRNHRARLIRHFLADIREPGIESRRDGWAFVFEETLDDVSEHMNSGDWLSSIKRGMALKRTPKNPPTETNASPTAEKGSDPVETGEEKKEEVEKGNVETNKYIKPLPAKPEQPAPQPLKLLRSLAARPPLPGEPRVGHLALCLAPYGSRVPLPTEDSSFDLVPANIGCIFSAGSFALQEPTQDEPAGGILYGLDGLQIDNPLDTNLRLVGGTFTFKGVNLPSQHQTLAKVLRLSIFVHISLILEQRVLSISQVQLKFPRPKILSPSPSTPVNPSLESRSKELREVRPKIRNSIIPSSFTNFLKRNASRSQTLNSPGGRGGSLDITVLPPSSPDPSPTEETTPRKSSEGIAGAVSHLRLRRFSFMGEHRLSLRKFIHSEHSLEHATEPPVISPPFLKALKRIEESKELLSTSAGIIFLPPKIVLDVVEKEKSQSNAGYQMQKRRLKGDERVALASLLGWDGKDAEGRGMSGILGFVRHQEISFLCSLYVPPSQPPTTTSSTPTTPPISTTPSALSSTAADANSTQEGSSTLLNSNTSTVTSTVVSSSHTFSKKGLSPCGKSRWITYRYYSSTSDRRLGEWIQDYTDNRDSPCDRPGCAFTIGQHERRIIHDGVKVVIRVTDHEKQEQEEEKATEVKADDIEVWESCAVCHATTPRAKMDDGAYLYSFAKFLELLIYSPALCKLTPALCEHTTPPAGPWASLPPSRFNITRHFSTATGDIYISLGKIEDIFEIKVPRLQIIRGLEKVPPVTNVGKKVDAEMDGARKKVLRREIRKWWEGISDHIDKIEAVLNSDDAVQKILPRLPSVDDAYSIFNTLGMPSGSTTPTTSTLPPLPPNPSSSPTSHHQPQESYFTTESTISTDTQASKTPTLPPKDNSEQLLATLRHNFQKIEQSLYIQLAKTPETSLNDVRRSFIATGKGTQKRLKAWKKKHLGIANSRVVAELVVEEPEWWGNGCHAVPGGDIIVRENDWGSIIAHTLSTVDYQLELANLSMVRSGSSGSQATTTPTPVVETGNSSFFSVATGYRLFTASSKNQPDPDQEDVVWNEPEQYSAVISRKNHVRDPTSLQSIRDVLRQKTIPEQSSVTASGSRFSNISATNLVNTAGGKASIVKAKADVAVNTQAAGRSDNGPDRSDTMRTLLQELESSSTTTSRPASIRSEAIPTSSELVKSQIGNVKAASIISIDGNASQTTIVKDIISPTPQAPPSQLPPPLPPKDVPTTTEGKMKEVTTKATTSTSPPSAFPSPQTEAPRPTSSGFASSVASGINSAVRYVLSSDSTPPSRSASTSVPTPKKQYHALLADVANIDERPHIKYEWTIGKRLKFSCTVYYAKQFDVLRKRCGINDIFLDSLSKSANWAAEGGKSKSNFWKTSDDRYIIKTLVNAWNVADLQVLAELAPSYFRYMDATANKATALAKLLGFYTIEIRNLENGNVQSKADLLVMENLFFEQNITKTFDLKGIQTRKVKAPGDTIKTLFDGEWIEGQQRTLTLIRPYSKVVLREAIKSDAEFLSKSNIMDYSLLLGVNEEKKEIVCGLVDTIGSYTFAKTLEYKAKHGLQSGKEVTVMPPTEYQERFVSALEGYFVACPDKWSKPLDESKIVSDPDLLPSVL